MKMIGTKMKKMKLVGALVAKLVIISWIVVLGVYWNRLFEALLVLVAIFQFELAYRQYWLNKAYNEPVFAVYPAERQGKEYICITIENIGSTPAYLLGVSRILDGNVPLPPEEWTQQIRAPTHACLRPSSTGILAIISKSFFEEKFEKEGYVMEVSYVDCFGEWKDFRVIFSGLIPIISLRREGPPGFFLSIGEEIAILRTLRNLHKTYRKVSPQK